MKLQTFLMCMSVDLNSAARSDQPSIPKVQESEVFQVNLGFLESCVDAYFQRNFRLRQRGITF